MSILSIALFRQSAVLNVSVKVVQLVSESTAHCLDVIFVICGMSPCTMLRRLTIPDPEPRSSLRVSTTLERRLSLPACLLTAALHHEGSMGGRIWRQAINKHLVQKRRKLNVKLIYFQKFLPQEFPGTFIFLIPNICLILFHSQQKLFHFYEVTSLWSNAQLYSDATARLLYLIMLRNISTFSWIL